MTDTTAPTSSPSSSAASTPSPRPSRHEHGKANIRARAEATWRTLLGIVFVVLAVAILARVSGIDATPWLANLLIVFNSLLIEALPFVLIGAAVSAAIEVYVPASTFEKLGRLPKAAQLPAAGLAGMAFPVCECGSVPVARRLASKGLSTGAAITFMLAAPVLNPIVLISTYVAYRGRDTLLPMVLGRAGLGFIVAVTTGWVVSSLSKGQLLRARPADVVIEDHVDADDSRWRQYIAHLAGDFLFMGRFLILGAFLAAAVQTFVPQSILSGVASLPILSLVAMMALAFLLSLCSESDAFVAASFVQFGVASQLAFLVFGPMMDMKLGAIYTGTFNKGFSRTVAISVGATTLVGCMWIQVFFG